MQLAEKCGRSFQPEQEKQRCFCFQPPDLITFFRQNVPLDSKEPEALVGRIMNIHYLSRNMSEVVKLTSVSGCANNIITGAGLTAAAHNTSAGGSSKTCFHTQSSPVFSLIFHFI